MLRPLIILAGLTLAGCAAPLPPPAGTQYDGSYVGMDSLLGGVDFLCGDARLPVRIDVTGGKFAYPFQVNPPRTAPLPVQVAVDGSAFGQMQYGMTEDLPYQSRERFDWVTLNGRIAGSTLDATIGTLRCTRRVIAERRQSVGSN